MKRKDNEEDSNKAEEKRDPDLTSAILAEFSRRIAALEKQVRALTVASASGFRAVEDRIGGSGGSIPDPGDDGGNPPPPSPPPPVDAIVQIRTCLENFGVSADDLDSQFTALLQQAEQQLNGLRLTLFPSPQAHANCFRGAQTIGLWTNATGVSDTDLDNLIAPFNFVTHLLSDDGGSAVGILLPQRFLGKVIHEAEIFANRKVNPDAVITRTDFTLIGGNIPVIRARAHIVWSGAFFPFSLDPPSANVTAEIAFAADSQAGTLTISARITDIDTDVDLLEQFFGDFIAPPFPGLLDFIRAILPSLVQTAINQSRPQVVLQPIPLLLPRPCDKPQIPCLKAFLQFNVVMVDPGTDLGLAIGWFLSPPVARQPSVRIVPASQNPIRVRISQVNNTRLPLASGRYRIQDDQDLRGSSSQWTVTWTATRANVLITGTLTAEVYFNLDRDGPFHVGQQITKTVTASVSDIDCCTAQSSFQVLIMIVDDPDPDPIPRRPRFPSPFGH